MQEAALPEGEELDTLSTKLEIIGESAEAYLFFTDNEGNVLIASNPDKDVYKRQVMACIKSQKDYPDAAPGSKRLMQKLQDFEEDNRIKLEQFL